MPRLSKHSEWLCFIDKTEPFLSVSILDKAFPQGLEAVETPRRQKLRAAYEEWREAVDQEDKLLPELHREWVRLVLTKLLEYDHESLIQAGDWPDEIPSVSSQEHAGSFTPDWIVRSPADEKPHLFITILPPDTDLESVQRGDDWPVSLQERMTLLCRAHNVRVGLLTDGERWMLVNAPVGSASSQASWYARLWFQESITLKAFQSLLGVRRCFGPTEDNLASLLDESLKHQEEVTDTLGEQVRRAVEVLVQCLDKADEDRNRELLHDVKPSELYEAGLTVMMRLVFVLCAEERGLLLLGDSVYDRCYAVSTLRGQLSEEADRHGPEVLDRRHDAWARLLAVFRAVYGGIEHESLRMPALGGSLFDPDRFPFLEGRAKGTRWRDTSAAPLPIDNRTVLLLLNSLQILEQSGGALLLSYRALDVEQIGHVYEGLLEHTVARVPCVTLGLHGSQKAKNPNVRLAELESARLSDEAALVKLVLDITGRSESAIKKSLSKPADDAVFGRVLGVCGGDTALASRIRPFTNLIRTDAWDDPIVYRDNSFMVTLGADRRETGTHYTPKFLTESIVATTLEPVVYFGPADGKPREEWTLKSSRQILDLKVCDPAMGSGAFLVQVCRYLGEKLVEAWLHEEAAGKAIAVDGEALDQLGAEEPLPSHLDERLNIARRLVAERCLYGVDINPLAVELAKLSIWLVTLAKGRPFGFLDHNLRSGDSLLGIHRLDQLTQLSMSPTGQVQLRLFGQNIKRAVSEAIELRQQLREMPIRDIRDVEAMAHLDADARRRLEVPERIADAFIGNVLALESRGVPLAPAFDSLAIKAGQAIDGGQDAIANVISLGRSMLATDLPPGKSSRHPFHWPIEYPEVFSRDSGGFDAVIGNPPFLHGRRVSTTLGSAYQKWLRLYHSEVNGSADLVAYFSVRMFLLTRPSGSAGFIATKTIAEGDTRETSLDWILKNKGYIAYANPDIPWPGSASVRISVIVIWNGIHPSEPNLGGRSVAFINSLLSESTQESTAQPKPLASNKAMVFTGTYVYGKGFVISTERKEQLINLDANNTQIIRPYLRGEDINRHPSHKHSDWVIDFGEMSESAAREWSLAFAHLEETVKTERMGQTKQIHEPCFWKHWDKRPELYSKLANLKQCLVHAFVGKHIGFAFVDASQVIATPAAIWPTESRALFAVLQSSFHAVWVIERASKMGTSIRYTPSDCFQPFALPAPLERKELVDAGAKYESYRASLMEARQEGLTTLYNRFHSQNDTSQDIEELRRLHREVDRLVAQSYGWIDLEMHHGFFDTKQGIRYSIDPQAQRKVLDLLIMLNMQRYQDEVQAGLHSRTSKKRRKTVRRSHSNAQGELTFHDISNSVLVSSTNSTRSILDWLQKRGGWHAKADILTAIAITDGQWNAAINDLIASGRVERQGERRGARYRAVDAGGVA